MTTGVYSITNTVNGRIYVGSSTNIERRWRAWKSLFSRAHDLRGNKQLRADWATHGEVAFQFLILEETAPDVETLIEAEQRWISHYGSGCYNVQEVPRRVRSPGRPKTLKESSLYGEIGEQIMLARRRAKLTQRGLGERLGISHVAVGDIERGKTKPNLDNLAVIADALGVPLSQIVVLED